MFFPNRTNVRDQRNNNQSIQDKKNNNTNHVVSSSSSSFKKQQQNNKNYKANLDLNKLTANPNKEVKFKEEGDNVQNKGSGNIFFDSEEFQKTTENESYQLIKAIDSPPKKRLMFNNRNRKQSN